MARVNNLLLIWEASNVVIKNSIFENANTLIRVFGSKVYMAGLIFKNAGFAHIHLSHTADSPKQTILTVKNTV